MSKTIDEKTKEFSERQKKLLEELGLEVEVTIDFPRYREVPNAVQLALAVFEEHGGVTVFKLTEKNIDKKDDSAEQKKGV